MEPRGRERHRWANREVEWSFWEKRHRRQNCDGSNERVANLWTISRFAAAEIQSHTAAGIARTDDASHYNFASD